MTTKHVVIRREDYVAGTRERPEVGVFVQTHVARPPVPWRSIATGDVVFMKWASGPIVAKAVVKDFRKVERCTPALAKAAVEGYRLAGLDA